jgi:hypothetical protein
MGIGDRLFDLLQYWTLLVATPAAEYGVTLLEHLMSETLPSFPLLLVREAALCLDCIREGYEELLDKIEFNLGDRDSIWSPDDHDKLLIDDQSFKRSRRYFWTIDALDTFSGTLEESLKMYREFTNSIQEGSQNIRRIIESKGGDKYEDENFIWNGAGNAVNEAQKILERIIAIKERTIILRDGVRTPYPLGYRYLEPGFC